MITNHFAAPRYFVCRFLYAAMIGLLCYLNVVADDGVEKTQEKQFSSPSAGTLVNSIWFDSEKGVVNPVRVESREDDSKHRKSRWLPQAGSVAKAPASPANTGNQGNGWFNSNFNSTNVISWTLLAFIVLGTGLLVSWILGKGGFGGGAAGLGGVGVLSQDERLVERMQHLPEELRRENLDYRAEAERMMRLGAFDQGIILLFAYQLLLLDRSAFLRLNRGKTNRQYLQEMRASDHQASAWFQRVVNLFERSYFGRRVIAEADFRRCWKENEMLEARLSMQEGVGE